MARGRPAGSKNKPKAPPAEGGPGHNSGTANGEMTDDQRHALTVHHRGAYETALKAKKAADAAFKNIAKLARADLGARAIDDIKDLIAADDDENFEAKIRTDMERRLQVARWAGFDIGFQADLFAEDRLSLRDRAANEGQRVGLAGEPCTPPANYSPGSEGHQGWIDGWHKGQGLRVVKNIKPTGTAESGLLAGSESGETRKPDDFDEADGADGTAPWPDDDDAMRHKAGAAAANAN